MVSSINTHNYDENQERRQEGVIVTQEDIDRIDQEEQKIKQLQAEIVASKEVDMHTREDLMKALFDRETVNTNVDSQERSNEEDLNKELTAQDRQEIANIKNENIPIVKQKEDKLKDELSDTETKISETIKELEENKGNKEKIEKKLEKLKAKRIMIIEVNNKIDKASKALDSLTGGNLVIEDKKGNIKNITSIEGFLEEYQLGLNEGITEKDPETGKEIKLKRKKLDNETKMIITEYYYEAIFKPLGLKNFADPKPTLKGKINENFNNESKLDEFKNDKFELNNESNEKGEIGKDVGKVGDKLLEDIAIIEGRKESNEINGNIIETVNNLIGIDQGGNDISGSNSEITDPTERKMAKELWNSIKEQSQGKISELDQAYLFAMSMKQMSDYRMAFPDKTPELVHKLLDSNQNKLIHQTLWDLNTVTSSDHGIKHILRGNATLAENVFNDISDTQWTNLFNTQNNRYPENDNELNQFKARLKTLTRQAIIDHDLGYTNKVNKSFDEKGFGKGFHMVSDHPLRSTIWVKENEDFYKEIFDDNGYKSIVESLPGHGSAQTQNIPKITDGKATEKDFVRGILSCVDCAGSPGDYKIAHMFAQKEMIGGLYNAYSLLESGDIENAKKALKNLTETIDHMEIDGGEYDGIKESRKQGIKAFLDNKNYENMDAKQMKKALGFHFNKFLGAFGVVTSINPETGTAKIGINEKGGWGAEFQLAGESFELLAEKFGAGVALKSIIGVCDDYGINDKGPTSKFIAWQTQNAINNWKENGKDKPLKDYMAELFNRTPTDEEISQFNMDMKKTEKDAADKDGLVRDDTKWGSITFNKADGKFYKGNEADDAQIDFSPERGIIIKGSNNTEITLNFEGNNYEGFNDTIKNINIIDSEISESILKLRLNPENFKTLIVRIGEDLAALGETLSEMGMDASKFKEYTDEIVSLPDQVKGNSASVDDIEYAILRINDLRSAYRYQITKVQSSNPMAKN